MEETVKFREKCVTVERNTVDEPLTNGSASFKETIIKLTEHAKVPVISTEARLPLVKM